MTLVSPDLDLTVRRAAPSREAYDAVASWFDDEVTTELFLREIGEAGFKVVPIGLSPISHVRGADQ